MTERVPVLAYYSYLGRDSQTPHETRYFCGACTRGIGGVYGSACYGFPEYPDKLLANNETYHGLGTWERDENEELDYYSFCPWCGAEFENEWWQDRTIQNERAIDHYQNPGHHKGDTHEFRGSGPGCMNGHHLGSTDPDHVCWCEPEIMPGIMGCVIRHSDKPYADYLKQCEEERQRGWEADE